MKHLDREDLKVLPIALLGLAKGIGEVIIKPFVLEETEKIRHVTAAAIHYYSTSPEEASDDVSQNP